jgi:hypothetical protein
MKSKQIQQLREDFDKYCRQIGIIDKPRLVLRREEMHRIQVEAGHEKHCGGWGSCYQDLKCVFVDTGIRIHYPSRTYTGWKNPNRELVKHKSKYIDFRNTLVHELVHYRFPKYRHGKAFEKRVKEIIQDRPFPSTD